MSRSCSSYPCPAKWSKTASIGLLPDEQREGTCRAASARAQAGSPSGGSGARVAWFPLIAGVVKIWFLGRNRIQIRADPLYLITDNSLS